MQRGCLVFIDLATIYYCRFLLGAKVYNCFLQNDGHAIDEILWCLILHVYIMAKYCYVKPWVHYEF